MAFVIAISNQKGGVGKTTTAINTGAALAERGAAVVLVDLDPHAGLTKCLGFDPDDLEHTAYEALNTPNLAHPERFIQSLEPKGLSFVPGSDGLAQLEIELRMDSSRYWQLVLKSFLDKIGAPYDYILVDCPPSLGLLTINALSAANAVLVPVQPEYLSLEAINTLEHQVSALKEGPNPNLTFRILRTMRMARRRHHDQALALVEQQYPDHLFQTVIPHATAFPNSNSQGQPLIHYEPSHKGADAYRELSKEIQTIWPSN